MFADRYDLGPVIGHGGMAEVYAARDTRLDRAVAIKVMRAEAAHQPLVRERFEAEARMAARLVHPNVVSVFDSGEQDGLPYIVMERLSGQTLGDRLAEGRLPESEVREMALEVLAALEVAHAAGILHRDIKPANVLAAGGGRWKVADFGIAKALEVDQGDATATGVVLGTPAYVAPERLLGSPASVTSDLYSVGVVLYEALAGRRPYDNGTPSAYPGVVSGVALTSLASLRPGVDPVLAGAIERSLAREPSDRFQSAAQMAAALRRPPAAVAVPPTTVLADRPEPTEVMRTAEEEKRRNPTAIVLGILASLIVVAAIVWGVVAARHHNGSSTTSTSQASTTTSTTATTVAPTTTPTTVPSTTAAPTTVAPTTSPPTTPAPATTLPVPTTAAGAAAAGNNQG